MRVVECEQGSTLWHATRAGRATGSRMADVMAKGKGGAPSAMRATYMGELVAERLSGFQSADGFKSAAMKWGTDNEPLACAMYAFMHDVEPVTVGFVLHPTMDMAGASPDRLLGDKGCMQVKCPNTATHIEWLLGASVDGRYVKQMMWEMACTEREFCEFLSYDPRLPPEMQMFIKRFPRDDAVIRELEKEVRLFLSEVDEKVEKLRKLYLPIAEAA